MLARNYSVTWYGTRSKKSSKVWAEGLDPDDPAVIAAIDLVRWELSLGTWVTAPRQHRAEPGTASQLTTENGSDRSETSGTPWHSEAGTRRQQLTACGFTAGSTPDVARPYFAEAIGLARAIGDRWRLSQILGWQVIGLALAGDPTVAGAGWCPKSGVKVAWR
jgi:hypothetical protein